jgi:protein-L-isoaspartate O-methyltransferase
VRKTRSLDSAYFENLYQANPDPWGFESRDYEARKYARTLAVIGERPVTRALELGCSIGVLTLQLASICDRLVATELSSLALETARRRCAGCENIDFVLADRVTGGIDGGFDLMLVYYWDDQDLRAVAAAIEAHLSADGRLVLVHWLGETDYPRSADDAVRSLQALIGDLFDVETESRNADYRLDVWRRRQVQPTAAKS